MKITSFPIAVGAILISALCDANSTSKPSQSLQPSVSTEPSSQPSSQPSTQPSSQPSSQPLIWLLSNVCGLNSQVASLAILFRRLVSRCYVYIWLYVIWYELSIYAHTSSHMTNTSTYTHLDCITNTTTMIS